MESAIEGNKSFRFNDNFKEWIVFGICLICTFLFLFSAYEKIIDHSRFEKGLSKVSIIGSYANLIAWTVPILEIFISLLLIIPKTHRWGLYGFASLMTLFTAYILSMLLWKEKLPCHCNLILEKLSWEQHLWFNLVFIGLSIGAVKLSKPITKT